jgi:hypothetical protein
MYKVNTRMTRRRLDLICSERLECSSNLMMTTTQLATRPPSVNSCAAQMGTQVRNQDRDVYGPRLGKLEPCVRTSLARHHQQLASTGRIKTDGARTGIGAGSPSPYAHARRVCSSGIARQPTRGAGRAGRPCASGGSALPEPPLMCPRIAGARDADR